jgi:hypothetical protein
MIIKINNEEDEKMNEDQNYQKRRWKREMRIKKNNGEDKKEKGGSKSIREKIKKRN